MDYTAVLSELSLFPAVTGHERDFSLFLKELFAQFCDEVEVDRFYNVIATKKGFGKEKKRIMVSAHMDEIGLMVRSIEDGGFIGFTNMGGVDVKILLAQEVIIHGKKDIVGVIGAKPPHLLKPEETKKAVKLDKMVIDTGMKTESLKDIVSIGDVITFRAEPFILQERRFSSKSIDNRCGIAAMIRAMEELSKLHHFHDVVFTASVQEEVGLRGAVTAGYNVQPDIAIVIDACHGDIPDASKDEIFSLGKGPAVSIGPNLHKNATRKLIDVAKEENISYQTDVEPGETGTEAWALQVSRSGVPTVLISIPVRYMHTTVETLQVSDMKNAGILAARFAASLDSDMEVTSCC